jgi:DNA repair exonuclease SbcCD ATPase subunit
MLKRRKLSFGNIGRFVRPQEIDFASKGRLVQIDGQNKNSNGSSGAGKSTLLELTNINLGISETPSTVYQSRYTKDPAWTEGEYENNGVVFTVRRVTGKGLTVKWTGPEGSGEISGDNSKAEEKIAQLIGMETDLFRRMTHKAQKQDGFFLSLTPSKSFGFMMKVMGMEDMLKKLEKVDALISESEKQVSRLQLELASAGSKAADQSAALEKVKSDPVPPAPDEARLQAVRSELELKDASLVALKADAAAKQSQYRVQETALREQASKAEAEVLAEVRSRAPAAPVLEAESPRIAEIKLEHARLMQEIDVLESAKAERASQIQKALDGLRHQKTQSEYAARRAPEYQHAIDAKNKELEHLSGRNCPTCLQKWIGLDMEAKVQSLRAEIDALAAKVAQAEEERARAVDLQEKIARAEGILADLKASQPAAEARAKKDALLVEQLALMNATKDANQAVLAKHSADVSAHAREIDAVREAHARKLAEAVSKLAAERAFQGEVDQAQAASLEREVQALRYEASQLETAKAVHETAKATYERNVKVYSDMLAKSQAELDAKNAEYQTAQQAFLIHTESKRLLKSFTNKKFEESLETIGRNATERLNKIPNMATASIYFEPFKEVKGKIKEEITVVLSMDGDVGIPLKSLSGGERSAADLAVDLAVADFIEEHSGMGADYMVLDEPCAGMDAVCKQEYIEMLKTISTNKQIFIVEHSSEVKEMVDDTITVVRDGLYSEVK